MQPPLLSPLFHDPPLPSMRTSYLEAPRVILLLLLLLLLDVPQHNEQEGEREKVGGHSCALLTGGEGATNNLITIFAQTLRAALKIALLFELSPTGRSFTRSLTFLVVFIILIILFGNLFVGQWKSTIYISAPGPPPRAKSTYPIRA